MSEINEQIQKHNELIKANIYNSFEKAKTGEGSRGGKIIGHTKSGKPIYDVFGHAAHKNFTAKDHDDAKDEHSKLSDKHYHAQMGSKKLSASEIKEHEDKETYHSKQWTEHLHAREELAQQEKRDKVKGKTSPIFVDDGNDIKSAEAKILKSEKEIEDFVKSAKENDAVVTVERETRLANAEKEYAEAGPGAKARTRTALNDAKYYVHTNKEVIKNREWHIQFYKKLTNFSREYNKVYHEVKNDITSADHSKVESAIAKLQNIYPREIFDEYAQNNRTNKKNFARKSERPYLEKITGYADKIKNDFTRLSKAETLLHKTDAQRKGYGKLSAAMSMRWGSF